MKVFSFSCLTIALALSMGATSYSASDQAHSKSWLFTYFVGNGEDGLHLASSEDGYFWTALNGGESLLTPEVGKAKLMRDPCAVRGPDGVYHMVWTSGWWEHGIGYASTRDFVHWSPQREIPVMSEEPTARNCWAPEITYDEKRDEFIIFWATTIPGRFAETADSSEDALNHRIYFTTTRDFSHFAPTKLFLDPGFSVIDATFATHGDKRFLIIKDETVIPPHKYLEMAPCTDVRGPFGEFSKPISPAGLWVEGPTAIEVGGDVLIYFDVYRDKRYGAIRSRDMKHWEDVSDRISIPGEGTPARARHGTMLQVPSALVSSLKEMTR